MELSPIKLSNSEPSDTGGRHELLRFIEQTMGEQPLRVEESLGDGFVRLRVSEAERRQAKQDIRCVEDAAIELLRNARDAGAHCIYLATQREAEHRRLVCIDDGAGIPHGLQNRIFEARVTSKLNTMLTDQWGIHGRGMALYSISQNAVEAGVCLSEPGCGTALNVLFDCNDVPERADQSSWPTIELDSEGNLLPPKGPRNLIRAAVEFALTAHPAVKVYFGSPTEILATMHTDATQTPANSTMTELPLCKRVGQLHEPRELAAFADNLGLTVSERTCYRIVNAEIKPLEPVADKALRAFGRPTTPGNSSRNLRREQRSLKIDSQDLSLFSEQVAQAFHDLGQKYYLSMAEAPHIKVTRSSINITLNFNMMD